MKEEFFRATWKVVKSIGHAEWTPRDKSVAADLLLHFFVDRSQKPRPVADVDLATCCIVDSSKKDTLFSGLVKAFQLDSVKPGGAQQPNFKAILTCLVQNGSLE